VGTDKLLYAIDFVGASRDKTADFVNGIAPDCAVTDDYTTALGTAGEKLLAGAITRISSGACPPAGLTQSIEKSLAPRSFEPAWGYRSTDDFARIR
jgi:hypothetical protein